MAKNHGHESITPLREYMNHASNLYRVPKVEPEEKRLNREEELEIIKLSLQSPKYMVCLGAERERSAWEAVRSRVAGAVVFNFSNEITHTAGVLSTQYFPVLVRLLPMIRLPFPRVVFAYDNITMLQAQNMLMEDPNTLCPSRVDLLWSSRSETTVNAVCGAVMTGIHGHSTPALTLMAMRYSLHTTGDSQLRNLRSSTRMGEQVISYYKEVGAVPRLHKAGLLDSVPAAIVDHLLGSVVNTAPVDDLMTCVNYLDVNDPPWVAVAGSSREALRRLSDVMYDMNGHLRGTIALLALLTLRDKVVKLSEPTRRKGFIVRGSIRTPYLTESKVTLTLPEAKVYRAIQKSVHEFIRRRRHDVRGTWCQKSGIPTCPHIWEDVDPNRKKCKLCDRKWFWRKAHMRGDASLGFVRHSSYEVEQRGELVSRGEDNGKVDSADVD